MFDCRAVLGCVHACATVFSRYRACLHACVICVRVRRVCVRAYVCVRACACVCVSERAGGRASERVSGGEERRCNHEIA